MPPASGSASVQRSPLAGAPSHGWSGAATRPATGGRPGSHSASGPGSRAASAGAPLDLARPHVAPAASTGAAWAGAGFTAAAAPVVQASRPSAVAIPGMPPFTMTPVAQREPAAAPAAPAGSASGGQRSDAELDELAKALFGRIRSHLRAEVIHEREAKGLSFDAF
jgi:hypothetical protein